MPMLRLLIFACLVALAPSPVVRAQPSAEGAGVAGTVRALSPDEARRALEVLNDPQKRAEVTATLQAIAASLPPAAAEPSPQPSESSIPLAPNSLGAQVLV